MRRDAVQAFAGETVLKGEDFKKYVNLLREKSITYKQKRAELSDLKAEYGVLERTLEVLRYEIYIGTSRAL
jgi:intraflagellar transport protein 81